MQPAGEQQVGQTLLDAWAWRADGPGLPKSVDVAVIGGGIIGVSTALFLARQGISVLVCEKGRLAGEHERQVAFRAL